jgi:hypothetical protein
MQWRLTVGTTSYGSLTFTAVARTTEGTAAMSTMVKEALGTQWQLEAPKGTGHWFRFRFRFRYVLHPFAAKYSHWMWH